MPAGKLIKLSSLRRWINEYEEYGESAFPGHGNASFNSAYDVDTGAVFNSDTRRKLSDSNVALTYS
jgi:transposase